MKATVNWQNNMVFIGKSASGFPVQMDADPNFGGTESGVRPMEMIAWGWQAAPPWTSFRSCERNDRM
jgi:putative redox protein